MEKISGVIITFNEEKNIERCIRSVLPVVNEIVIVDSFSNDSTEEICSKFESVRFFARSFDNYSNQKNWAIRKASYPLVLSINADEVLSDELIESIKKVKDDRKCDAYYCNRLNNYCGIWIRHGSLYPDKKLRLWDIRKGYWDDSCMHDRIVLSDGAITGQLKGDLLHHSYDSISKHLLQIDHLSEIFATNAFKNGKKSSVLHIIFKPICNFGIDYFFKGGILDGFYGFVIVVINTFTTFVKYVKLRQLWKTKMDNSAEYEIKLEFKNNIV